MTEAQEKKNHTDPIDLSSRTPLGQLMRRAVTYTHQAGADGSTAPFPSRKKFSLFLGPPSYMTVVIVLLPAVFIPHGPTVHGYKQWNYFIHNFVG